VRVGYFELVLGARNIPLSEFPNTLLEAFLIAFRYGESMVLRGSFCCSGDSRDSGRSDGLTSGGQA
jgi:hypothetical protein